MKLIAHILQLLYFVYAGVLFIGMMVPVALFAVLASSTGAIRGGNLIFRACRLWGAIWFPMVGIFHKNSHEEPANIKKQPYIYIANHISWLDAALVFQVFRRPLRPLGKAEVARVPVFGLYRWIAAASEPGNGACSV